MHPSEHKKLTHYSPLIVMGVLGLMVGIFIAVIGSQQSQDNRSQAAVYNGTYTGTLTTNGNVVNGNLVGDVIGNSNTITGNVSGCVRGNSNIINGKVFGTVTGTGNIARGGIMAGPCVGVSPTIGSNISTTPPPIAPTLRPTLPVQPRPTGSGRTLTVAQNGSGMYTSIQLAGEAAQPGDTILISGGTYKGPLDIRKSGTPQAWITFQNKPGEKVIIDGTGVPGEGAITIFDHSNLVFNGINVINSQTRGIFAVRSNNIVVENCEVSYSKWGGIVLVGNDIGKPSSRNALVQNCYSHHNSSVGTSGRDEAITIYNYDGFEVKNNLVLNNGEEGIDAKYGAKNGSIHHNEARGNNGPNIYLDAVNSIRVYNNIVSGSKGLDKSGIGLAVETIAVVNNIKKTNDIDIYNNVVYGNALGGVGFWIESTGSFEDIRIINNTIYNNRLADIYAYQNISFTGTNIVRNNILLSQVDGLLLPVLKDTFVSDHNLLASSRANVGLVDMAAGNARLMAGSAAIDAGIADLAPRTDMDGTSRPAGNGYDIGAYEFGGVAGPNPTARPIASITSVPPMSTRIPTPTRRPTAPPGVSITAQPASTLVPTQQQPVTEFSKVSLELLLHGLGNGGDNTGGSSRGNFSPLRPQRSVTVEAFDKDNALVATRTGLVTFDSNSGSFKGVVDMGDKLSPGFYTFKVVSAQYVKKLIGGITTVKQGFFTYQLPKTSLSSGDINGDNFINILDFNILANCYSDLQPAIRCTSANKILADLTDDGNVNQLDYNLFIREIATILGD